MDRVKVWYANNSTVALMACSVCIVVIVIVIVIGGLKSMGLTKSPKVSTIKNPPIEFPATMAYQC